MDKKKFYDLLRSGSYRSGIPQSAVTAMEEIIDLAAMHDAPAEWVAYMLATAKWEVGPGLVPKRESLNYHVNALMGNFSRERISQSDAMRLGRKTGEGPLSVARQMEIANTIYGGAWGKNNLGNTQSNDGWVMRGGGYPQTTGRRNFREVGKLVGVDLETYPARIIEPHIACMALVLCMMRGTYTGKKLADYSLPGQYVQARAIINADGGRKLEDGRTVGARIAIYANQYLAALKVAGYSPASVLAQLGQHNEPVKPAPLGEGATVWHDGEAVIVWSDTVKTETTLPVPATKADKEAGIIAGIVVGFIAAVVGVATWSGSMLCKWTGFFCGG